MTGPGQARPLNASSVRVSAADRTTAQPDPVQVENALPGYAPGLTPNSAVGGAIEGYASEVSALPGDTLHLHVSTSPAAPYRVEIDRLGWYDGAGARLIGCTPSCSGFRPGQALPAGVPDASGLVRAGWPVTDTFVLPADATSGYYRIRFILANGPASATYVIVRAPAISQAAILVQVPVNTWQAYNSWGGRSLYDIMRTATRANRVSFDRPYAFSSAGNQSPLGWEYPLVYFLEQQGYDVSYQTDLDTERDPSSLLGHRLVIDIGHDEYWTETMRYAFEAARDANVNLAFMGANDAYWRMRYEDGGRTIAVYKSQDDPVGDPAQKTGLFRVVDSPECELIGIQHQGGKLDWQPADYTVVASSLDHPWFSGTGFDAGSVVHGVVGIETDTIPLWDSGASCGHQLTVFFHHEAGGDQLGNADAVAYTTPGGATVFASGSKRFDWGLADPPSVAGRAHGLVDPRLQRFVRNMLDDLSARRVADLGVELSAETARPTVGRTLKVLARITNNGSDAAPRAALELTLPSGLTFVRVASTGARCTRTPPLQCTLAPLEPGSSIQALFTLRATARGTRAIRARTFALTASDPDQANNEGGLTIRCRARQAAPASPA
jgi:hypothetical protein